MNDAAGARMDPARIAEQIASIRRSPSRREELVALLSEQSAIYSGLGAGDAERIRGFVLASFEETGLPESAIPFVVEELETGTNPYTVAGAAKALRGMSRPSERMLRLLVAAAQRIESNDDFVQHDTLNPGDRPEARTSAVAEIIRTLSARGPAGQDMWDQIRAMGDRGALSPAAMSAITEAGISRSTAASAPCCCGTPPPISLPAQATSRDLRDLALEDQSGTAFTYRELFHAFPSVVTFFYTRCMNPQKCSLTVSKLAALQRRLAVMGLERRINVCAFTYDPAYDRAERLRLYGADRAFRFDDRNRFIRTVGPFDPVRAAFNLNVGFGETTVNRHSVELIILDATGRAVREFRRVQWDEAEVADVISGVVSAKSGDIPEPVVSAVI